MWSTKVEEETRLRSTVTAFDPTKYMSLKRFQQIKRVFPFIFADEDRKQNDDPWWQIASAFHQFNENRQLTLAHLSFVLRKPENITDKKTAQVSLKIMKGCMHNRIEQLENEEHIDMINSSSTPEVFLGDAWFASVDLAYHSKQQLNVEFIGVIKTNSGRYPKQFLENTMKDWPGGSHLVLKTAVDGIDLFAIGYKYCKSKTLMFIMTDGVGHTEPGEPYLAKWIDNNLNQMHRRIPRPAAVSFYFNHSNVVDIHNQQRQKELRLEKCWVTQDGYFRIITTLIGITVVDAWRGYTDDTICTDSHTLSSSSTNDKLPMAYVNVSSTTGGSPTVVGAIGEEINSEVTYSPDNSTTKLTVGILDELKKHNIVQTSQVEHDSSKSCGWRPKRSICIMNGCKKCFKRSILLHSTV